jgi:hypothetical protein
LPDREPRPRSLRNETLKDAPRLGEAVASEEHFLNPLSVPAPLFNLVRVSPVGIKWIISFPVDQLSVIASLLMLWQLALSLKAPDWAAIASAVAAAIVAVFTIVLAGVGRRQNRDTRILQRAGDADRQAFVGELVEHVEHPIPASPSTGCSSRGASSESPRNTRAFGQLLALILQV